MHRKRKYCQHPSNMTLEQVTQHLEDNPEDRKIRNKNTLIAVWLLERYPSLKWLTNSEIEALAGDAVDLDRKIRKAKQNKGYGEDTTELQAMALEDLGYITP